MLGCMLRLVLIDAQSNDNRLEHVSGILHDAAANHTLLLFSGVTMQSLLRFASLLAVLMQA